MAKNLLEEFLSDSLIAPNDMELLEVSKLAQDQQDWEIRVKQLETDLDHAKESLRNIQEFLLPEAMATVGMSEFKLSSGAKITIKDDVYVSIKKDYLQSAVDWLDENGLGGIVKDQVSVDFGRGEYVTVKALMEYCQKNGMSCSEKLSVHPQTLKATVKEQLANGVQFPEDYFSIAPIRKAIIKTK